MPTSSSHPANQNTLGDVVAIIPARGGSKGIPGKNLKPVAGKPMLVHSIEHARHAPSVSRVLVSTDDPSIASIARSHGAEVIDRPIAISGDTASSESALLHALDQLGVDPELVVFLQATSPIRESDDVERAITTLRRRNADSLFSACPAHGFIWRNHNTGPAPLNYDPVHRPRRQDAPEDLVENGSIYVFKPWVLRQLGSRLGGQIAVHRMSTLCSFQVDEPEDLTLIELVMAQRAQASGTRDTAPTRDLSKVELLVLDFDGVMTDNRVLVDQDGGESVSCNRGDGLGIAMLKRADLPVMVLSTERNPVVSARCQKLGIECVQGQEDKLSALVGIAAQRNIAPSQIAYVGNDVNDLACMRWVGFPIAVADAVSEILSAARWVTTHVGGAGAVREVADAWLRARRDESHARRAA